MNKLTKTFFGLLLGTTISLGIGVGLKANSSNQIHEVKAATAGRFNVFIHPDCYWKNDSAHILAVFSDSTNTFASGTAMRITPDSDLGVSNGYSWIDIGGTEYAVLSMAVDYDDFTYDNFLFGRHDPSNSTIDKSTFSNWADNWAWAEIDGTWYNQGSGWVCNPKGLSSNNTVVITKKMLDSSTAGAAFQQDWGNYWKMTTYSGKASYSNLSGATKSAYLKSAGYEFVPGDPGDAPLGYEFAGWYTETSFTNQWTSSSRMTADTTLYAKYNAVNVTFNNGDPLTWNSTNQQYEAIEYFNANDTFHIVKTVGSVSTNFATLDTYVSSSVATSDGTNVTVKVAGTYAVYFKNDNTIYLGTADPLQEAYMYAGFFLTNVGCDATGASLPSGWTTVANRYATLSDDAKDIFYSADANEAGDTIEQTVARYDHAIASHTSLTKFMVNKGGTPRASHRNANAISLVNGSMNNAMIIVVVIASLGILTAGAYYFFKKSRKSEE